IMYLDGMGVNKDFAKAKYWIGKAKDSGSQDAMTIWNKNKLWKY
ncbi:TPA: sel1 repeat family protein, partial [Legionella pneumophila]|nr:sel1 repeat family protein [Legionella pneumophila]